MTIPNAQNLYNSNGGSTSTSTFLTIQLPRDPGPTDIYGLNGQYPSGQRWINTSTDQEFYLDGYTSAGGTVLANWKALTPTSTSVVETITGTSGGAVGPDVSGNISFAASGMTIVGNPSTNTLTFVNTETQGIITIGADSGYVTGTTVSMSGGTSGLTTSAVSSSQIIIQGTLNVSHGGTGADYFTSYAPICAGTTSSGVLQAASTGIGSSGYVLMSNGASTLPSFQAVVNSFSLNQIVYTTNATYIPSAGMAYCQVDMVGGGGGGGGAPAGSAVSLSTVGVGGGGGEYARGLFSASTIGASRAIIIGAGGVGHTGAAGDNGGTTSFSTLMTAIGGTGGGSYASPGVNTLASYGPGAAGGTGGIGGYFRTPGGYSGSWRGDVYMAGSPLIIIGGSVSIGSSGSSVYGFGVYGVNTDTPVVGISGIGYGCGGGGSANGSYQTTGGNGTSGVVIVTEYIT